MNIKDNVLIQNRDLRNFCILRFIFGVSYSFMIPIIPLFFESVGITTLTIGVTMSLYGVGKALAQIPFGIASDTIGDKILLIGSMMLMAIIPFEYTVLKRNIFLCTNYVLQGIILGMAAPATFSILSRSLEPSKRGECTGYASAVFTLGGGVGAFIGGYILSTFNNYNLVFYTSMFGIVGTILFIILKIKRPNTEHKICTNSREPLNCRISFIREEIRKNKLSSRIILLGFIALLGDFIYGCVVSIFPFYGQEVLGGSVFFTSTIISIYLLVFGIFAPLGGFSSDKIGVDKQLLYSFITMNIALLLLGVIRNKILFSVIITIYFLGATFLNAALQNSLLKFGENKHIKGFVFGFVGASESVGYAIGPIVSSYIYNINKGFLFFSLLCFSMIIFIVYLKLRKKAFDIN